MNQNGNLAKIEVTPFQVTIKGLDVDYDFCHQYKTSEWEAVIGYLQRKALCLQSDSSQVIDKIGQLFKKSKDFSLANFIDPKGKLITESEVDAILCKEVQKYLKSTA